MATTELRKHHRAAVVRSARIVSGLFLLAFITTHLVNLILGLHSLELIDQMRPYLSGAWTGPIASKLLLSVLLVHFILGLDAIYRRETLRMSANDMVQFLAGLLIVPLLMPHALGIAATNEIMADASYAVILKFFWLQDPIAGLRQVVLLGVIWVHGCLGLFIWMRSKKWSVRVLPWLYPLAVAIPVLALLGYVAAGRQVLLESKIPAQVSYSAPTERSYGAPAQPETDGYGQSAVEQPQVNEPQKLTATEIVANSKRVTRLALWVSTAAVILTLLARLFRVAGKRNRMVEIDYVNGPVLKVKAGPNLLDIARQNDLPHANICHGRGRCGTCRVRVLASSQELEPASQLERDTLDRLGCGPGIRLACQLKPRGGSLQIERIFPADYRLENDEPPAAQDAEVA